MILDALLDSLMDTAKLLPFLFVTYIIIEYIEHKASAKTVGWMIKADNLGPLIGGVLGVVPQCGFSAAGSNLYAGRVITLGTLISIYLSTSDEMLPILISEQANPVIILKILGLKMLIGVAAGFIIDGIVHMLKQPTRIQYRIEHMCEREHCGCNEGNNIFKSALIHTLQIVVFILLISFGLNVLIEIIGADKLSDFLSSQSILSVFLAALIGLIPNCASSVVITELYLQGMLSFAAMMAGLLVGAGVGLLVLFRANDDVKDSLKVLIILYIVGVLTGLALLLFA